MWQDTYSFDYKYDKYGYVKKKTITMPNNANGDNWMNEKIVYTYKYNRDDNKNIIRADIKTTLYPRYADDNPIMQKSISLVSSIAFEYKKVRVNNAQKDNIESQMREIINGNDDTL